MRGVKCLCTRCMVYLRDHQDSDFEIHLKKVHFEERAYQTSLINIAKKRNIIACLPTGSGKTFIALKLMEYFRDEILGEKNKKVFFLANTIPLVNQQAAFFARNSQFKVKRITGDMDVDYWNREKWETIFKEFNVIAMTAQIYLNIIGHAFVKLSDAALLIFDECHHATDKHPMRQIMIKYEDTLRQDKDYCMPRILGLTATVINGNCTTAEVQKRVKELEQTMASTAVTYRDYEEVKRCSTSAQIITKAVSGNYGGGDFSFAISRLQALGKELNEYRKRRAKERYAPAVENKVLASLNNIYVPEQKISSSDLKVAIIDVSSTLQDLGPYCAFIALKLRLAYIEFCLMDLGDGKKRNWYLKTKLLFEEICAELKHHFDSEIKASGGTKKLVDFISPKLQSLINILLTFRETEGSICECGDGDNSLCGIVFTDRRIAAQVLSWYFTDLSKKDEYKFIRANFVVGSSRAPFETVESRIYARKQTNTINKFRSKKFNILIATSVLEEGIDVPSCNLVVRFDPVKTYTSYIQSMGRARKKGAKFYALLNTNTFAKESLNLDTFKKVNEVIVAHLIKSVEKIETEDKELLLMKMNNIRGHNVDPFCPGETPDSPQISVENGIDIVQRYCDLLPCDGISSLSPISWWEMTKGQYIGYLKLPVNSAIKETIMGVPVDNKDLARLVVYFETAKKLYEAKTLDDNFVPVRPTFPEKVEAYFKCRMPTTSVGNEEDIRATATGSIATNDQQQVVKVEDKKGPRRDWYKKSVPEVLNKAPPLSVNKNYEVYRICLRLAQEVANDKELPWKEMYAFDNSKHAFGLICSTEIPEVGDFPLYGAFGTLTVTLEKIPGFMLRCNQVLLSTITDFQKYIFYDVLQINNKLLRAQSGCYALVPLMQDHKSEWMLNERLFDQITSAKAIQNTRKPDERKRMQENGDRRTSGRRNYESEYVGAIVVPWYKNERPMYIVDKVETEMSPLSRHHESSYKEFYSSHYRTKIFNNNQPLLKCKLISVGEKSQLNYLLQKFAKEDEFPVYLVPELCFKLPFPGVYLNQLKLLPSILHRLFRLLLSNEILSHVGLQIQPVTSTMEVGMGSLDLKRLAVMHDQKRQKEEERRKLREKLRLKLPLEKKISTKKKIEGRNLHYEFIHPYQISKKDIKNFHTAVSDQHAAKKLTLHLSKKAVLEEGQLTTEPTIDLLPMNELELNLSPIESTDGVPTLLSIMEGITREKANDGVSYMRLSLIGTGFLNFAVSKFIYMNFPNWNEPLMCQLRNRILSVQYIYSIAKKRNVPEILAGADFYPVEHWLPPGYNLQENVGEIAARNQIHLGVYNKILDRILGMKTEELENFVQENVTVTLAGNQPTGLNKNKKSYPFVKFSSFTHAELNDIEVAFGFLGLVGAFFGDSGSISAYKLLEWLEFVMPNINGKEVAIDKVEVADDNQISMVEMENYSKLAPALLDLEKKICYSFKNKRLFIEAMTHPSFMSSTIQNCYQRLEFLGDAILDVLLTRHIFTYESELTLEQLREIRSALVNTVTYASLAVRYGLQKYLLSMSNPLVDMIDNFVVYQESVDYQVVGHFSLISDEECYGPKHIEVPKVLGDIFEALAGAIYIDSGYSLDTVWKVFYRLMQHEIDTFTESVPKSPLRELEEEFKDDIKFEKMTTSKYRSRGRELMKIKIEGQGHYYGAGTTVARAREAAAKLALKIIKDEESFTKDMTNDRLLLMI